MLCLKALSPTRLAKNELFARIEQAEKEGAAPERLRTILGTAASKRGIFEGDIVNGEIEIGQAVSSIKSIDSVGDIMHRLIAEYSEARQRLSL